MKLHAMIVQAVWESKSTFLMLPHITQDNLRHFTTKKRHIKTIRQFVGMKNEDRRLLLRTLSDEQYQDIINVCWSYPHLEVEVDPRGFSYRLIRPFNFRRAIALASTLTDLFTLAIDPLRENLI